MPPPVFAFLEAIGTSELVVIGVICLLLFGGERLPELARGIGKSLREFRKVTGSMQDELRRAMDEPATPPTIMPPRPASPEIKSTPEVLPPGATPPEQSTEVAPEDFGYSAEHHVATEPPDPPATPPEPAKPPEGGPGPN